MGEKGSKDFHLNVNIRTNTGSISRTANNEESFSRAMEIQEGKSEIVRLFGLMHITHTLSFMELTRLKADVNAPSTRPPINQSPHAASLRKTFLQSSN